MENNCEFCQLNLTKNEYVLFDGSCWILYLADNQNYPGRCIMPLKRHASSLSDLTSEEWTELHKIIKALELVMKEELGASNCNWTCLMNGGYSKKPYNPHVHFHIIPRYFNENSIADPSFIDENIAQHYTLSNEYQLEKSVRTQLTKKMKARLQELL